MNDWIALLFWIVGLGVVFLVAINLVLLRLVNRLWRENEELQPPF
jgi:cytoskeletal protein RodZ